jgi:Uma2 family endonuclease
MPTQLIAPPMTVDEFLRRYDADEDRVELIDGEVFEREMGFTHDIVKNTVKSLFEEAGIRKLGYWCLIEAEVRVRGENIVTPDVSLVHESRLAGLTGNAPLPGAPEIPIEIEVTGSAIALERKIERYLGDGALAVCVVYPELRSVIVYRGNERRQLNAGDSLDFPELLPGISVGVADLFSGLT